LFDRIINVGRYSEAQAAHLLHQMLSAVYFMHYNGIAHRDIKPENFLFESTDENSDIKLIDFGLSSKFSDAVG
jgi:calcium-dependent protein kinase